MFPVCTEGNAATTIDAITKLETYMGVSFPSIYKAFLLNCNGGRPGSGVFPIYGLNLNPYGNIQFFFGVNAYSKNYDLRLVFDWFKAGIPRGIVLIACTDGSDYICLDLRNNAEKVVYWEQSHFWGSGEWREGDLYSIADSFMRFLRELRPDA